MLTDTHCHLYYNKFDSDREAVIQRAKEAGLGRILVPGLDSKSGEDALQLAEENPMIYAAVGFHPTDLDKFSEQSFSVICELAKHPKVVAIGEIGIDYYWEKEAEKRAFQREVLIRELALAQETNKPVVIHMREENDVSHGDASTDLLKILQDWKIGLRGTLAEKPGVLHSFDGSLETAQRAIDLGFYIGVSGPITYKNADRKRQVIAGLPLDRLLIETDAPFLAPNPHRGKRNEPAFVSHIADKIAEIHSHTPQEIAMISTANAERLFSWGETV